MDHHTTATDPFAENFVVQTKRKPGRPPKHRQDLDEQPPVPYQPQFDHHLSAEPIFASLGLADDVVDVAPTPTPPPTAKRGRGRPPKAAAAAGVASEVEEGKRLKSGRPKLIMTSGGGAIIKRSAGRPKRIGGPVTVPLPLSGNIPVNNGGGGSVSRGRGRGRPPKTSGAANNIRKVESGTAVLVTDPHQLVAFQELKLKYEHLQSKAKEALSVVRPYVINSDYAVFEAVQELETLVADAPSSNV